MGATLLIRSLSFWASAAVKHESPARVRCAMARTCDDTRSDRNVVVDGLTESQSSLGSVVESHRAAKTGRRGRGPRRLKFTVGVNRADSNWLPILQRKFP